MDSLDKKFYKIKEVTEMLDIPASTLRFWETQFPIIKPHRNSSNIRFYTPKDLEIIKMIHYLIKEKGLKIEAAQEQIKINRKNISQHSEVVDRLKNVRGTLEQLLKSLNQIR